MDSQRLPVSCLVSSPPHPFLTFSETFLNTNILVRFITYKPPYCPKCKDQKSQHDCNDPEGSGCGCPPSLWCSICTEIPAIPQIPLSTSPSVALRTPFPPARHICLHDNHGKLVLLLQTQLMLCPSGSRSLQTRLIFFLTHITACKCSTYCIHHTAFKI